MQSLILPFVLNKSVYCLMVEMHITERPIFWGRLLGCGLLLFCLLNINKLLLSIENNKVPYFYISCVSLSTFEY